MKKIMFNDKYGLTQAVLEGRKTMTRRIAHISQHGADVLTGKFPNCPQEIVSAYMLKARYKVGEVIAIAQPYRNFAHLDDGFLDERYEVKDEYVAGWANKMFVRSDLMPHHIRITDVKLERLQDISDEDCIKEGVREVCVNNNWGNSASHWEFQVTYEDKLGRTKLLRGATPQEAYAALIDHISGKWTWDNNPYVFVYEFDLVD